MKTATIYTTDQRKIYTTNDMEDVREQIMDNSRMDGTGFITVSRMGDATDVNIQHIIKIEYNEPNEYTNGKNVSVG